MIATLSIVGTPPSDVTLGTSTHTHTIQNDDTTSQPTASFASASTNVAEDAGMHNVTVSLSSAAPSGGLSLTYSVTGTATAGNGNDFTIQNSGTLTVAAGATSATIPVAINDDSSVESAETVILTLNSGTGYTPGSPAAHTLTITDNDSTSGWNTDNYNSWWFCCDRGWPGRIYRDRQSCPINRPDCGSPDRR